MKLREINERPEWTFWVPDSIADWDAPSHWERARLASMQELLKPGYTLVDVGTEHGWLTAVYGGFCGHENVILVEPSPEFWPNIRLIWEHNDFPNPFACYQAFAGDENAGEYEVPDMWPDCAEGDEIGAMAYRYIGQHADIATVTIDKIALNHDVWIDAITIDIEGAELLALRGAAHVLIEHRPLVWVSIHPDLMERDFGHKRSDVLDLMASLDYTAERLEIDHEEHWLFRPEDSM